jgi:hypothetical protein
MIVFEKFGQHQPLHSAPPIRPLRKATGKKKIPLSPIAIEVVRRIDALFAIERSISSKSPEERLAVRRAESRPLVGDPMTYMRLRRLR